MPTITIVSQVIGFVSFAITLLTLLGVYRDFISTIRNAPHQIPILLGNLRQELEAERTALGRRMHQGDEFGVFPRKVKTDRGWKKPRTAEISALLNQTITELWNNFKALERPFLIRSGNRAEQVRGGDYWGDADITEKPDGGKRGGDRRDRDRDGTLKNAAGMEEATLGPDQASYYRTDFAHRFIWWQSKTDVVALMDQVQRVQVRRIERDVYETDELVKRCYRLLAEQDGSGGESGSGSEGTDGGRGGGGGGRGMRRRRSARVRSRSGSAAGVGAARSRSRSRAPAAGGFRASREVEVVRVRDRDREDRNLRRESGGDRDRRRSAAEPASNTGRRRETRAAPEYEYEVIRPGRIYVDSRDEDVRPRSSGQQREVPARSERDRVREISRDRERNRDRNRNVRRTFERERDGRDD